ncbi:hypothetical protein ABVT39_027899 [Epinephelus coioides]
MDSLSPLGNSGGRSKNRAAKQSSKLGGQKWERRHIYRCRFSQNSLLYSQLSGLSSRSYLPRWIDEGTPRGTWVLSRRLTTCCSSISWSINLPPVIRTPLPPPPPPPPQPPQRKERKKCLGLQLMIRRAATRTRSPRMRTGRRHSKTRRRAAPAAASRRMTNLGPAGTGKKGGRRPGAAPPEIITWYLDNSFTLPHVPRRIPKSGMTTFAISRISDIPSCFGLFVTEEILQLVLESTNLEGRRKPGCRGWKEVVVPELMAFLGLLLLVGVYRSRGEATRSMWDAQTGCPVFAATMRAKASQKSLGGF